MQGPIDVRFFVEGQPYAMRMWHVVPRVGDEVMLKVDGTKQPFKVTRVVWGVEDPK